MLAAETELKNAQKVKEYLLKHQLMDHEHLTVKEMGLIYFPVLKKAKIPLAKTVDTKFEFPKKARLATVEELLAGKLTPQELAILPKSQEVVGNILILEIPLELQQREKAIAEAYLKHTKGVETVVRKDTFHEGEFRLRTVKILAGKKTKETIHKENGILLKINLEKTYFSARSASERLRVAQQVKKDEEVLVMFSGAGPYALVIAKNSPAKKVYGIEINPFAHQLALQNAQMNRVGEKTVFYQGDIRVVAPALKMKFDRIAMPLPKTGEEFLDVALEKIKKGGIIHLYAFLAQDDLAAEKKRIKALCQRYGHEIKAIKVVFCGQFSPRIHRVCFDLKVLQ